MFWREKKTVPSENKVQKVSWAAVSVIAKSDACPTAIALKDVRVLSREAALLPLPDCTKPHQCRCVFRKHEDRRAGPRREEEETGMRRYIPPNDEKRTSRGRRKSDHEGARP